MNLYELVDGVANDHNLEYAEVLKIFEEFMEKIRDALKSGDKIYLKDFMTLSPRYVPAREVKSNLPQHRGKIIKSEPYYDVKISIHKKFYDMMQEPLRNTNFDDIEISPDKYLNNE